MNKCEINKEIEKKSIDWINELISQREIEKTTWWTQKQVNVNKNKIILSNFNIKYL